MKLKITKKVKDAVTKEFLEPGTVVERNEKRGAELVKAGVAEEIKGKAEPKEETANEPVAVEAEVSEPVAEKPKAKAKAKKK